MDEKLREIILHDHFGGDMPPQIVDQWVQALLPGSQLPLPPNIKGFYGCSLRPSMPIEVARGSYKHITHETLDKAKVEKYARRMLVSLDLLDIDELEVKEPTLAALGLWHRALAEVRLEGEAEGLRRTLVRYMRVREKSPLPEGKLPGMERLKGSLMVVAKSLGKEEALTVIGGMESRVQT
jgi:hypothetical protein